MIITDYQFLDKLDELDSFCHYLSSSISNLMYFNEHQKLSNIPTTEHDIENKGKYNVACEMLDVIQKQMREVKIRIFQLDHPVTELKNKFFDEKE